MGETNSNRNIIRENSFFKTLWDGSVDVAKDISDSKSFSRVSKVLGWNKVASFVADGASAVTDVVNGEYREVGKTVVSGAGGVATGALVAKQCAILVGIPVVGGGATVLCVAGLAYGGSELSGGIYDTVADYFGIGNDDKVDADDATKGKYEGSLDSAEQSYKDYTRPKNTGSSGSSSTDDNDSSKDTGKMAGVMGCPIVLDLDGAVSPSGVASHEPLPIISGAALGGGEVVIHSLSLSRVASSSPTQTILRVA